MASPAFTGVDSYGPDAYDPGGGWASSRTLSVPSFSGRYLVALIADYTTDPWYGNFHHWGGVPATWTHIATFGSTIISGYTNNVYLRCDLYACDASDVAATVRPEKADNSLLSPTRNSYFRCVVTGWSPAFGPGDSGTGNAGETRSVLPYSPPSPICDGNTLGTWVQVTVGNIYYGGGPTGISAANGFSDDHTEGQLRVASKTFSTSSTTDACIYAKSMSSYTHGACAVVALDVPPPRHPRVSVGILTAYARSAGVSSS